PGRWPVLRQRGQRLADQLKRDTHPLPNPDEGHPPQRLGPVAALITGCAAALDEALRLVEMQRRDGDPGPCGHLPDTQPRNRHPPRSSNTCKLASEIQPGPRHPRRATITTATSGSG